MKIGKPVAPPPVNIRADFFLRLLVFEFRVGMGRTDQGWQVSAKGGLNRGLNRFKPVRQKQVPAETGFCQFLPM